MKMRLVGLGFVCGLVLVGVCFGQEAPRAVLLDEHGEVPCDDTLGRLDVYFAELWNDPSASGLVVISAPAGSKLRAAWRQGVIEAYAKWRRFDASRLRFVRAVGGEELTVRLYVAPVGSEEPKIENVDMTFTVARSAKPFVAGYETKFGPMICPGVDDAWIFAGFLKDNPEARGNVVVRGADMRRARLLGARLLRKLGTQHGIARSRLKVFAEKFKLTANHDERRVEYWLLP